MKQGVLNIGRVMICVCFLGVQFSIAQTVLVGTVAGEDGTPLIGVNIVAKGTNQFTITDFDGKFKLSVDSLPVDLSISYTGYELQNITIYYVQNNIPVDIGLVVLKRGVMPECSVLIIAEEVTTSQNFNKLASSQLLLNPSGNIAEDLNRLPGVLMHNGTFGTNRLTMRGIGSRNQFGSAKIKGYWNDMPLHNTKGELTLEDVNVPFFDQVNVMRGPTPVRFGSGLGGVVQFKTNFDNKNTINAGATVGSYGLLRTHVQGSTSTMDTRLQLKLGYQSVKSDGYRQNSQYQRHNASAAISYTLGKRFQTQIKAFAYITDVFGEIPSSINETDFLADPSLAASNWLAVQGNEDYSRSGVGLSATHSTISNWLFTATHSVQQFKNSEIRPFNNLKETSTINASRIEIQKEELFNIPLNLVVGSELLLENGNWNTIRDNSTLEDFANVNIATSSFIEFQYQEGNFNAQVGMNFFNGQNYIFDRINGPSTDQQGNRRDYAEGDYFEQLMTSTNIKARYALKQQTALYASLAHGFSVPTQDERFNSDGTVNIDIEPEEAWTVEVGVKKYGGRFQYDIAAYTMKVNNALVPFRVSEERTIGINAGKTSHIGVEASADYRIDLGKTNHRFEAAYTYGRYTFDDFIVEGNDHSGNQLPGLAPHIIQLGLSSEVKNIRSYIAYRFVDRMYLSDDNLLATDAYGIVNLRLDYTAQLKDHADIVLSLGCNNIANTNYASMILVNATGFGGAQPRYYYPGLARNYYIKVTATLNN